MYGMQEEQEYGMHPEVAKYLKSLQAQQANMSSPEYQNRLASVESAQAQDAAAPQMFAAYGKALSQLGTLKGRSADTSALEDSAKAIDAQRMAQEKQENLGEMRRDKQTGLTMTMMNHLNDKYMANNARRQELKDKSLADATRRKEDQNFRADEAEKSREFRRDMIDSKTPKDPNAKGNSEANYRFVSLKNNAQKLKDLINKEGTYVAFGPEGAEMDTVIYEMAIDYAKLVDPDSVAREGEVAAAQKYMLPVRETMMGIPTMKNKTAISVIDNYMKALDQRLAARKAGQVGDTDAVVYKKPDDNHTGLEDTAVAAPLKKTWKIGETYTDKDGTIYKFNGHDFEEQ